MREQGFVEGVRGFFPFRGSCVEGMIASRAIANRLQVSRTELDQITDEHPVWDIIAHYIGHLCSNLVLTVSPQKIVIGGGIMQRPCLLPAVRKHCLKNLAGYIRARPFESEEAIASYIITSPFDSDAGLLGAAILALRKVDVASIPHPTYNSRCFQKLADSRYKCLMPLCNKQFVSEEFILNHLKRTHHLANTPEPH